MVNKILNFKTKTITSAALILGLSTLISGILGVLKMRLLAGRFGAGIEIDSYFAAFRIPDLLSATLITGGIIVVFLPLFSSHFQKNKEKAWQFTSNLLTVFSFSLIVLCFLLWILAPLIVEIIAPGFSVNQKELTVSLARIMFIAPLLFGISGIFSGILQYFDRFIFYALAPILYNIGIISGIVFISNFFPENPIYGVAFGVVLGAFLHLLIQIPSAIKSGFKYKFLFNPFDYNIKRSFKLMIPRSISQASTQVNLMVTTAIASMLSVGSVTIFNFANNLYLFPVAIIGVSFAVAAFPSFSRFWANNEKDNFLKSFSLSFRQVLFVIIPLAFLVFVLRAQIIRLVLGTGEFGWTETKLTAASLGLFSIGLLFAGLLPLLVRLFFSIQDTKTPAIIGVISVFLNIVFSLLFVFILGRENLFTDMISKWLKIEFLPDIRVVGLALATSLAAFFQFVLLFCFLKKKVKDLPLQEVKQSFLKIISASLVSAISCYYSLRLVVLFVRLETFWAILLQFLIAGSAGVIVYLAVLYLLKSKELFYFKKILRL